MAGAISPSMGLAAASCGRRSPACRISRIVRRTTTLSSRPLARSAVSLPPQPRRRWYTYTWRAAEQPLCSGRSLGSVRGAGAGGGQRGLCGEAMGSPPSSSSSSMARGLVGGRAGGEDAGHSGRQSASALLRSQRAATSRDDVAATAGSVCGDATAVSRDLDRKTTATAVGRRQWAAVVAAALAAAAAVAAATSSADVALADDCFTKLTETPLGLSFCDIKVGDGDAPQKGMLIKAHYTGRLASNGRIFDSSYDRGRPFVFRVGVGEVIKGWDVGILGTDDLPAMLPGGRRTLVIPPGLGYGERGAGCRGVTPDTCIIPPNSTLIFDVDYIGAAIVKE
ncbi:hypothetical protein CBR_g84888 [Chara braunii]|uniref:peptidylprolyl isomerase n=1 Tax=Chara braunii TaxID=69332 RepID=A0A388KAY6_CHABU|nr:hypothetical protein CBR_g84888 [Chara braunii]|eukprot:GBG67225.1 hypothetical protein CBR_g84888 [Chara braunii]